MNWRVWPMTLILLVAGCGPSAGLSGSGQKAKGEPAGPQPADPAVGASGSGSQPVGAAVPTPASGTTPPTNPIDPNKAPDAPGAGSPVAPSDADVCAGFKLPGPSDAVVEIGDASQLKAMTSGHAYRIVADIALTEPWVPLALSAVALDGGGKTITGLTVDASPGGAPAGLFGVLLCSDVRDLTLADVSIAGSAQAYGTGALAGVVDHSQIKGIRVSGRVTGRGGSIGGVVGGTSYGTSGGATTLGDLAVSATVERLGTTCTGIGGLVGTLSEDSTLSASQFSGEVLGLEAQSGDCVHAGAVGVAKKSTVIEAVAVSGDVTAYYGAGGVVGLNFGQVTRAKFSGHVRTTNAHVGGIIWTNIGVVELSVASGVVESAAHCGGAVADNVGVVRRVFVDAEIKCPGSGTNGVFESVGGLVATVGKDSGTIENSHFAGKLAAGTGTCSGGLAGTVALPGIKIDKVYARGDVTSISAAFACTLSSGNGADDVFASGAFWIPSSSYVAPDVGSFATSLTSTAAGLEASFPGWDFATIWEMAPTGDPEVPSAPRLRGLPP